MGSVPAPMLATAGRPPTASDLWATEMKWDGMRIIAVSLGDQVRLYSRNGREATSSFPELVAALNETARGRQFIIDGEIIAPQLPSGIPSFSRLQHRMHTVRPPAGLIASVPTQLFAFDALSIEADDVTNLPYVQRRDLLDGLELSSALVRVPPYWTDIAPAQMLDVAEEHGLEGIVVKRLDSAYLPGQRSRLWIKSALRRTTDVVVAGYFSSSRRPSGLFGSLILGGHTAEGVFIHVGNVGTGFSMAQRRVLQARLDEIAQESSPFETIPRLGANAAPSWVAPTLVATVYYREFTTSLRHPSWAGLRADQDPHSACPTEVGWTDVRQ
ncbi:ATP-dependent DNA ligase [Nocardia africana]|nr:RNA ligase family protein [Nocardia africana]MCC3318449.1 ATP-dependent DNA ligase [Nocardia africana]